MAVSEKSILNGIEITSVKEQLENEIEANQDLTLFEREKAYSHKADLEKLLKLAEELKQKCDRTKNKIKIFNIIKIIGFALLGIWTFSGFLYVFNDFSVIYQYSRLDFGLFISGLLLLLYQIILTNDLRKEYFADKLALVEVLQLLRETSDIIAKQEFWSVLSRAEFRIRLSRFGLEEESKSALNFFS